MLVTLERLGRPVTRDSLELDLRRCLQFNARFLHIHQRPLLLWNNTTKKRTAIHMREQAYLRFMWNSKN
jgi:hypothetical protein